MESLKHLTPQKVAYIACRLSTVSSALNGFGSLFLHQGNETCIGPDEYAGIGDLLQGLSKEVSRLEDILRCGYDSIAKAEMERNYAD